MKTKRTNMAHKTNVTTDTILIKTNVTAYNILIKTNVSVYNILIKTNVPTYTIYSPPYWGGVGGRAFFIGRGWG